MICLWIMTDEQRHYSFNTVPGRARLEAGDAGSLSRELSPDTFLLRSPFPLPGGRPGPGRGITGCWVLLVFSLNKLL